MNELVNESIDRSVHELSLSSRNITSLLVSSVLFQVIWLMIAIAYNGMNYYSPEVGPNPYLSYALTTLTELPANFAVWPLVQHWGRRWTLISAMILGGVCCVTTIFVPRGKEFSGTVMLVCLLIGKFCSTCADIVIYLYSGELLPTPLRSLGIGVVSTMGMLGYIVVPFVLAAGRLGAAYQVRNEPHCQLINRSIDCSMDWLIDWLTFDFIIWLYRTLKEFSRKNLLSDAGCLLYLYLLAFKTESSV